MYHTAKCLQWQAENKARREEWLARWPHACEFCEGHGGTGGYENGAPLGAGYWAMPVFDVCQCLEVDYKDTKCPRCGGNWYDHFFSIFEVDWLTENEVEKMIDNSTPCPLCGWSWDAKEDDACPRAFDGECGCWLNERDNALDEAEF